MDLGTARGKEAEAGQTVLATDDTDGSGISEERKMADKYPRAKKVQHTTHAFDERRAHWEADSNPRTAHRTEMQFFNRQYEDGERRVLVVREFGPHSPIEATERPATLTETVDFAIRANLDIPGEPVVAEILEFAHSQIEEATTRLAHIALTHSQQ